MIERISATEFDIGELNKLASSALCSIEDLFDYSQVVVQKPWGYEYLIFSNQTVAVWILYLESGAETSMHCHPNKKTSLVVLEGKVRCSTLAGSQERFSGEGVLIEKGVFHQTRAISTSGAFVMEVETPVNKHDLVRLKDKYGREGKGYETVDKNPVDLKNDHYFSFQNAHFYDKHFLEHSASFRKIAEPKSLNQFFELVDTDILCLLSGELIERGTGLGCEIGDSFAVGFLKNKGDFLLGQNSEILIIKERDFGVVS